jgi:hypothetical protein
MQENNTQTDAPIGDSQTPAEGTSVRPTVVTVTDGVVFLDGFEERDPTTVSVVESAPDQTEAVHRCLRLGAQAVGVLGSSLDVELVDQRFEDLAGRFDDGVKHAVDSIAGSMTSLLDDSEGALPAVLEAHRESLDDLLGTTFDPESKKSVLGAIDEMLAAARRDQAESIRSLVSIEGEDSPLQKLKRAIVHDVGELVQAVQTSFGELSDKIATQKGYEEAFDKSAAKGFDFEEVVHGKIGPIATIHGDLAERVGGEPGATGRKVGDEVVKVNREDTNGREACFVIEAKKRKMPMKDILSELDEALENRQALAAIAVFSSQDIAPTKVPFQYWENKAIVALDEGEGTDAALRLAYIWARWVVRRQLSDVQADDLDIERVSNALDGARLALERLSTVKRAHTNAVKMIEQAGDQVVMLVDGVNEAIEVVREEFGFEVDGG